MYRSRLLVALGGLTTVAALVLGAPPALAAPPVHDDISAAKVVGALPYTDAANTREATTAADDPFCVGRSHTVWYRFTPSQNRSLVAHTFGSNYDTTLSAYTGTRGNLTQIACNDDFQSLQSRITFDAQAGVTYWLMVGSFDDSPGGSLSLTVAVLPPPQVLGVSIRATGTVDARGVATVRGTVSCSRAGRIDVVGSLRQERSGSVSLGYFSRSVFCSGTTGWSAVAPGETGRFRVGSARAQATAIYDDPVRLETVRKFTARTIQLVRP